MCPFVGDLYLWPTFQNNVNIVLDTRSIKSNGKITEFHEQLSRQSCLVVIQGAQYLNARTNYIHVLVTTAVKFTTTFNF